MTAQVFLAAFLGCLLAMIADGFLTRTVIKPLLERKELELRQLQGPVAPSWRPDASLEAMLEADQKLRAAAFTYAGLERDSGDITVKLDALSKLADAAEDLYECTARRSAS